MSAFGSALQQKLVLMFAWPPGEVVVEHICLSSALWWVLQLAPSAHLFESNAGFKALAYYGSERPWQLGMAALLILQAWAMRRNWRILRTLVLILFGGTWMFVAALFYAGNAAPLPLWPHGPDCWTRNTGVGLYSSLGIGCVFSSLHLGQCVYLDHLVAAWRKKTTRPRRGVRVCPRHWPLR